jgi:hemoglobin/transferrin/lactoferrin receptor protein
MGAGIFGHDEYYAAAQRRAMPLPYRVALSVGVAAIALASAPAFAQQVAGSPAVQTEQTESPASAAPTTASVTVLDQVTVVSKTGESAIDTMASVSHIDKEQLDRRMSVTVGDTVFGVPGVTAQTDNKRVGTSFNIRGLQDFGRVAVIVDGARQDFQRSGHGTQSVTFIDPELLEEVDVIRGPVANTYGSGAIGGVVFMETKDAEDFLRDGETWGGSLTGRYDSNGEGWTTSATAAYKFNDTFDVLGNVVYRDFGDYKDGDGDRVEGTGFEVLSGMLKSTIHLTDTSELKLGWVGADDSWAEGAGAYNVDVKQNTFTGRYHVTDEDTSWLDLHINASYNGAKLDQKYQEDVFRFSSVDGIPVLIPAGAQTGYDLGTTGIDIWNTSRFETGEIAHELTYGGDWVTDDVDTSSPEGGDDLFTPSGKRTVAGAYIQEKLTYEWLEIVGALRYDSYKLDDDDNEDVSGNRLSPRITVGVSPFDSIGLGGLQIYGTYAEGYRSPSLSETLISGLHPNGVVFPFLPNPDLKPETGKTWEIGLNYAHDGLFQADDRLRLKAAYYNNDVDDYIGGTEMDAGSPGCPFLPTLPPIWIPGGYYIPTCFQYQNYAEAKIKGFELEGVYDAAWGFAGLSVSLIDGHTESYDGAREDLATIPSSQVTGQLGFRFLEDKLTIGTEVQYNGAPKGNDTAEDYTLVNLFASYQATEDFRVDFRADNIFDEQYVNPLNGSTTTPLYEPGITLKIGATIRFGGSS